MTNPSTPSPEPTTDPTPEAMKAAFPVALVLCGRRADMSYEDFDYWLSVPQQDEIRRARDIVAHALDAFAQAAVERERAITSSEREARHNLEAALRKKDEAMGVLFARLNAAGVDCSDLIP